MKKTIVAIAATAAALVSIGGTAQAAPVQSINQREAVLAQRIDQGVRTGALTRGEAMQLRNRLQTVQRLERNYRRGGLSFAERQDLERRLSSIEQGIRFQKHDGQFRGRH